MKKNSMIKKVMIGKLKSSSGESIAETLVAVLIAAFALLMLAGTINTSSNLITKSKTSMKDYYENTKTLVEQDTAGKIEGFSVKAEGAVEQTWTAKEVTGYQAQTDRPIVGNKKIIAYH